MRICHISGMDATPPPAKRMKLSVVATKPSISFMDILSKDIMEDLLERMIKTPKHILHLAQTCKYLHQAIFTNDDLWYRVLCDRETQRLIAWKGRARVISEQWFKHLPRDLQLSPAPNFRRVVSNQFDFPKTCTWPPRPVLESEIPLLAAHSRKIIFLEYGQKCGICGYKHGLLQVWSLGVSVCDVCYRDNLISNNDLFLEYGVVFWTLFKEDPGKFKDIFMFRVDTYTQTNRFIYQRYAWSHMQSSQFKKIQTFIPVPSFFLWLPHLKKTFDLNAMRIANKAKQAAAEVACGYFRALYVRLLIAFRGHPATILHKLTGELVKKKLPSIPDKVEMLRGIQSRLTGRVVSEDSVTCCNLLKQFFSRFSHRRTVHEDHNQRKIVKILRTHESERMFNLNKFAIPGSRYLQYTQIGDEFHKLVEVF